MALALRGTADREALIRYVDSYDVPSSWREGPLNVTLGGETVVEKPSARKSRAKRQPAKS